MSVILTDIQLNANQPNWYKDQSHPVACGETDDAAVHFMVSLAVFVVRAIPQCRYRE